MYIINHKISLPVKIYDLSGSNFTCMLNFTLKKRTIASLNIKITETDYFAQKIIKLCLMTTGFQCMVLVLIIHYSCHSPFL